NFYSYTEPEFPTVTHHWGTGVIFYHIWKSFGFYGVSLFYTAILLATFLIFFWLAQRLSSFSYAFIFAVLSLPLITSRVEIRPEGFSALLLGVYFFLLYSVKLKKISFKVLWVLPFLQLLWTNLHIFFIFGPFLILLFLLDNQWQEERVSQKLWVFLFLATALVCFINPFGIKGVLTPFFILKEYGYMLAENQSVFFMQKRFPKNPLYIHYELMIGVIFFITVLNLWMKKWKSIFIAFILLGMFSVLAFKSIRAISFFGFLFIPCGALLSFQLLDQLPFKRKNIMAGIVMVSCFGLVLAGLIGKKHYYSPYQKLNLPFIIEDIEQARLWSGVALKNFRILPGLLPRVNQSAEFFKQNHLEGPIFNNYDIGGYLIYHLYPTEKLFVDNRPESYSVDFFQKTYIPMQSNEKVWQAMDRQYQFNCIYFYRHDITPWAQPFLIRRITDPAWAPVYVDWYTIILLKRNPINTKVIQQYELPQSLFSVSTNE
ncbi:MAG: hypothetical protein KC733_11585, partial [Candidatus Omnitrophica bacterium]|nr:hypothetical protein [Candidatus Omnitrophota bacterium]